MNRAWLRQKVLHCFLLLQSRPFVFLVLSTLALSPRLPAVRIAAACILVVGSVAMAARASLRTGEFFRFGSGTEEVREEPLESKRMSGSLLHAKGCSYPTCTCGTQTKASPVTRWTCEFSPRLRRACQSLLQFLEMYVLSNLGEGLFEEGDENCEPALGSEQLADNMKAGSKLLRRKHRPETDHGDEICRGEAPACAHGLHSSTDSRGTSCRGGKAMTCTHRLLHVPATELKIQQSLVDNSCQGAEGGDVPDLEDCSAPSEEEEVFKRVLENTTNASSSLDNLGRASDVMLQPTAVFKAATSCPSEDEHSIEKRQILPREGCQHCKSTYHNTMKEKKCSDRCICHANRDGKKIGITDAELQKAASEYYTLEGDVLWCKDDLKKQSNASTVKNSCDFCRKQGDELCQNFSVFSLRTQTTTNIFAEPPASSKVVHYLDKKRPFEGSGIEEIVNASAEKPNEDAVIDQELRAIARSCNNGESSNYMSTAGSFRDYLGSFREMSQFWSEYDSAERQEDGHVGCCDNHARACALHSKSRSKVLQTDPLLSKTSLIREQEIMDVLWQEYDDDKRHKQNMFGKHPNEIVQKQSFRDVLNEGSTAESFNVFQSDYVMKFNKGDYDDSSCRFGCDKPCCARTRGYQRRRYFMGLCKLFREFGLKQCMQRSKVDN